jgi:outer membrane protein assembly factor BamB
VSIRKPLRLWPGLAIAIAQLLVMFGAPIVAPDVPLPIGILGGVIGAALILLWWLFFSRAPWVERLAVIVLMVAGVVAARSLAHISIVGAGQGNLVYVLSVPYLALALVSWAVLTRHLQDGRRHTALVAAILLVCTPLTLIRTDGVSGGAGSEFHWRWTPTAEERLLAQVHDEPKALPPAPAPAETAKEVPAVKAEEATPKAEPSKTGLAMSERQLESREMPRVEWPGFRGPDRDSVIHGVQINTNWSASPPVELWRRPVGPGWSSFSVQGDVFYTQEQRGEEEIVSAYSLRTGEPVWRHRDLARFYESNGGPGPRSTPTLSGGRVYTHGATGIVNALNARDGSVIWTRNASTDTGAPMPGWGFTSSPLVLDDLIIVSSSGRVVAYDNASGQPRWTAKTGGGSYSSPHLVAINGVTQIVLLHGTGATGLAAADGKSLWHYAWDGAPILQPTILADGELLITSGDMMGGMGTRRISVAHGPTGWTVQERWSSRGLKPYFNDIVVHEGHAYGFDGSILACIDLADGNRRWKGGRYGNGQLVLLADQDLLLVISEEGELALVSATPDQFQEVSRFRVLNDKTWNHPVLVGDVLLVRNGEEMAAYRLSVTAVPSTAP